MNELMKLFTLTVREMKNIMRFPYFELVLLLLTFQLLTQRPVSQVISFASTSDLKFEIVRYLNYLYLSNVIKQVESLYLIIVFLSSAMSYLAISYFRDIGFFKIEFSLPIRRSFIYLSKFLAPFLVLLLSVISSVYFSVIVKSFNILQAISPDQLLLGLLIVFIEAFTVVVFVSSITTLLSFVIKWPVIPFIVSIAFLYSLNIVSYNLKEKGIFLLPTSLEVFEERALSYTQKNCIVVSLNLYSLEPLLFSLFISFLTFMLGYYYVCRRLEVS